MTPSSAVALRLGAATALFWVSLTMAVEGRVDPNEQSPAPAFQDFTTDRADLPAGPVLSKAGEALPEARRALPDRPAALAPLYVSFAALQVLDIHSTLRAPDFGAREANPLVGRLLASPAAFVASCIVVA